MFVRSPIRSNTDSAEIRGLSQAKKHYVTAQATAVGLRGGRVVVGEVE